MQESCSSSRPLCICSKNMTTDQLLRHMRQNLQLDHFELAYHSLEPEKGRRLCMTGICRQCGQRLCYGVELPHGILEPVPQGGSGAGAGLAGAD